MTKTRLETTIVIAMVLNHLGVVSESIDKFDVYHGLSISVKVANKSFLVDSEKIAFLRSIGINVDVEIEEGGEITMDITLPYENKGGIMEVDGDDIAKLLCEFFKGMFYLSEAECETEGFVASGYLSVKITQKDGDDLRLDFHRIDALTKFDITPFVRPVNSTTAIVGFVY